MKTSLSIFLLLFLSFRLSAQATPAPPAHKYVATATEDQLQSLANILNNLLQEVNGKETDHQLYIKISGELNSFWTQTRSLFVLIPEKQSVKPETKDPKSVKPDNTAANGNDPNHH